MLTKGAGALRLFYPTVNLTYDDDMSMIKGLVSVENDGFKEWYMDNFS